MHYSAMERLSCGCNIKKWEMFFFLVCSLGRKRHRADNISLKCKSVKTAEMSIFVMNTSSDSVQVLTFDWIQLINSQVG